MMTDGDQLLRVALRERGVTSPAIFRERYGVSLDILTPDEALRLLTLPDHPRDRDRATWAPIQRERYIAGCLLALGVLRNRLENGRAVLDGRYSLTAEVLWLTLATRAVRLIALLARADRAAENRFLESGVGAFYTHLDWPEASEGARMGENPR